MMDFRELSKLSKTILFLALFTRREPLFCPQRTGKYIQEIRVRRRTTLPGHYEQLVIEIHVDTAQNDYGKFFSTYKINAYEINYNEANDEIYTFYDVPDCKLEDTIYAYLGPEGLADMPYIDVELNDSEKNEKDKKD